MRKRYFLFLFAICLVCCLCACGSSGNSAPGTDDESTNSASGTLPEVESEHTNAHRVRIETSYGTNGELYYRQEYIYGDDGGYASITSYRADGSESGHVDLTYNEQGDRLIGYRTVGVGRKNTSDAPLPLPVVNEKTGKVYSVQYEYDYDSDGRIIKQIETDDEYGDGACTYEYEYDSTGKKVCSTMYRENSNEYRKTIYEYDSNGNLTVSKEYRVSTENPDGNLSFMMLYEYDSENREIMSEHYSCFNREQFLNRRVEKEYNEAGKLLKISYYDANGLIEYMLYYYDEQGTTSSYETHFVSNGQESLFERIEFTYE